MSDEMYGKGWWERIAQAAQTIACKADIVFEKACDMEEAMHEHKWSKMYPNAGLLIPLFQIHDIISHETDIEELKRMFNDEWEARNDPERLCNWGIGKEDE